jgi:uncharacterized repeat protein (TIGR03803 family)
MSNGYFSLQPISQTTRKNLTRMLRVGAAVFALFMLAAPLVQAQWGEIVLHSFCSQPNCTDGSDPVASLIVDARGNLYGTTRLGGNPSCNNGITSCGTVFKITSSRTEKVLHTFNGLSTDGSEPEGSLVMDSSGNLYGTTSGGGDLQACFGGYFCGTVFVLTPSGKESVLYKFGAHSNDGFEPTSGMVMDGSGNFYGATSQGGNLSPCLWGYVGGCGTIFKVTPSGQEMLLYTFCPNGLPCTDGAGPVNLVFGPDGNLYGTTTFGGDSYGTVFKVTPTGEETVLHSFSGGADGAYPFGSPIFDASGNLYGTTAGGAVNDAGTVFELAASGNLTVLHTFGGPDGANSYGGLIMDKQGNLYGTTEFGGAHGAGVVFELTPSSKEMLLYNFTGGPDGGYPEAGLVIDAKGNLYGTTGSIYGADTVFELTQRVGTVTLSPTSLNFGNQLRYTTSKAQSVMLTNGGPHVLIISSITASNDPENPPTFAISANTCGARLGVGQSCAVSVTFTPTKLGTLRGELVFVENAPGGPQTVALSGTGVEQVALTPRQLNFGKIKLGTSSVPKTFTLTNNLSVALTGIAISTTGDFAVSSTTCGTSLGAIRVARLASPLRPRRTD